MGLGGYFSPIAAKIIARTAFLKSRRLLTAQYSSNLTASYAASTIASVGRARGLRAASASLRNLVGSFSKRVPSALAMALVIWSIIPADGGKGCGKDGPFCCMTGKVNQVGSLRARLTAGRQPC